MLCLKGQRGSDEAEQEGKREKEGVRERERKREKDTALASRLRKKREGDVGGGSP